MTTYLDSPTPICLSPYNLHGATMTIKGSLQMSIAILNAFLKRNFKSSEKIAPNWRFWPKATIRRSRSFKVIDFGTNQKPIGHLLVLNTNLPSTMHCFQVTADYMSNFHYRQAVASLYTHAGGDSLQISPKVIRR